MKKITQKVNSIVALLMVIGILLPLLSSCQNDTQNLVVNGKPTHSLNTYVNDNGDVIVSLIDILQELSFTTEWQEDKLAVITKGEQQYFLDFEERMLKRKGEDKNLLDQRTNMGDSLATQAFYTFIEKDVVLDMWTAQYLLYEMGTPIIVRAYGDGSGKVYVVQELSEEERQEYNIVINGKKLKYDDIETIYKSDVDDTYVIVPVKKLLKDIGCEVLYSDTDNAVVWVGLLRYTISLENEGIMFMGNKLEADLAGGRYYEFSYVKDNELYMSTNALKAILTRINLIDFMFNYNEHDENDHTVYVLHPN